MITLIVDGTDVHDFIKSGGYNVSLEAVYDTANSYTTVSGEHVSKLKGYKTVVKIGLERVTDEIKATLKASSKKESVECSTDDGGDNYKITNFNADCALEKTSSNLWGISFNLESVLLDTEGL